MTVSTNSTPIDQLTERECFWQLLIALSGETNPENTQYLLKGLMDVFDRHVKGGVQYAKR